MRKNVLAWVTASALWVGCGLALDVTCDVDEPCEGGAVCLEGYCIADPLPRIVLSVDRKTARIGDMVRVDGTSSRLAGAPVELSFRVEPAGAAELRTSEAAPGRAEVRVVLPDTDFEIVATASSLHGREAVAAVRVAAENSPPRVTLRQTSERFVAGDSVGLVAEASDPDGDPVSVRWSLLSTTGQLVGEGGSAVLRTSADPRVRYTVRVDADDGRPGGSTYATITLQPGDYWAPTFELEAPPEVEHACEGEPLACAAEATLKPIARALSAVSASWRLVGEGPVTASFEVGEDLETHVVLRCEPACPIAGAYLLELTLKDGQDQVAVGTVELRVGNRPPIVRVHDGSELGHVWQETAPNGNHLYRVARVGGAVVTYEDPDGDPPDLDSIEWSSSGGSVVFEDPKGLDTGFVAIGRASTLRELELRLVAADWNGATASDASRFPIHNRPPTVRFDDVLDEGHRYAGVEPTPYRKSIPAEAVNVSDTDGDPVSIEFSLPPSADPQLRLVRSGDEWLIGGPAAVVGFDHEVVVTARDEWGGVVSGRAKVRISNRRPVARIFGPGGWLSAYTENSSPVSCCGPGGCTRSTKLLSQGGAVMHPLEGVSTIIFTDPDGDPIDLRLGVAEAVGARAWILSPAGNREIGSDTGPLCSVTGSGVCEVSLRMTGRLTAFGTTCNYDDSTLHSSHVYLDAIPRDALGAEGYPEPIIMEAGAL